MATPTKVELVKIIEALLEYIDAIPDDAASTFPAMPGIDRDYVDYAIDAVKKGSNDGW